MGGRFRAVADFDRDRTSHLGAVSRSGDVACQKGRQFEPSRDLFGDHFKRPFHSSGRRLVLCCALCNNPATYGRIFFMRHLPSVTVRESLDSVFGRAVWCSRQQTSGASRYSMLPQTFGQSVSG